MRCKKAQLLISVYLDGILRKEEKQDFLKHIEDCEECKKELESTRELLELFSEVRSVEKEASFYQEIMSGFYMKRANIQKDPVIIEKLKSLAEAFSRPVIIGACGVIVLFFILVYSNVIKKEEQFALNGDEIEFLLEEHALFEEQKLFSSGAYSTVLASANFYKKTEVSNNNVKK